MLKPGPEDDPFENVSDADNTWTTLSAISLWIWYWWFLLNRDGETFASTFAFFKEQDLKYQFFSIVLWGFCSLVVVLLFKFLLMVFVVSLLPHNRPEDETWKEHPGCSCLGCLGMLALFFLCSGWSLWRLGF